MPLRTTHGPALSVLDTVPVDTGQRSGDAVRASLAQAGAADAHGYRRYWFAEHHNTRSVASITPAVLAAAAAAGTVRIRVGSGGVMLPNHTPLAVAEQFASLEAIAPGRVDLGIGRSIAGDSVVSTLLNSESGRAHRFADSLAQVVALLEPDGAAVRLSDGSSFEVRATPDATGRPELWVLGSSASSAAVAGSIGASYVFAHHFFERGAEQALDAYRAAFRPRAGLAAASRAIVTANTVVADTDDEARAAALPHLLQLARIETGRSPMRYDTVESAAHVADQVTDVAHLDAIGARWCIGTPDAVAEALAALAACLGVDEVMLNLASGRRDAEPADRVESRLRTLALLDPGGLGAAADAPTSNVRGATRLAG